MSVSCILSGQESKAKVSGINPNLLDNWYFADPIDQRHGYYVPAGTTYYTTNTLTGVAGITDVTTDVYYTTGSVAVLSKDGNNYWVSSANIIKGYFKAGYTIDRWNKGTNVTATLLEDGLELKNHSNVSGSNVAFQQVLEESYFKELAGKKITYSVLESNGALTTNTVTIPTELPTSNQRLYTQNLSSNGCYIQPYIFSSGRLSFLLAAGTPESSTTILAVKMELGSEQTLAYQDENGNWILNDPPPNKQQELAKCQRYFVNLSVYNRNIQYAFYGTGSAITTKRAYFAVPVPVPMRSVPGNPIYTENIAAMVAKEFNTNVYTCRKLGGTLTIDQSSCQSGNTIIMMNLIFEEDTFTPGDFLYLENWSDGKGHIWLSAEL